MKLPAEMRTIPVTDRGLFNAMFLLQHYFPKSDRLRQRKDGQRLRIVEHVRRNGEGKVIRVERVKSLTPAEFRRKHLASGTPVIIDKAAADWTCTKEWSFDNFRQRFGASTIKLVQTKGLSDDEFIDDREFTEELGFKQFLDQVEGGGMKYMRFSPVLEQFPELLKDFDRNFLREMPGTFSFGTTFQAFIGGKGTFTRLHNAPTPFFFVNVCGIKRWAMIPNHYMAVLDPPTEGRGYNHSDADVGRADPKRFPGFESIDRLEARMEPGDILYVPSWMWHSVQNDSATIGVRCGFVYPKSIVQESLTLCLARVFAARNPSLLEGLYYSVFRTNLPERYQRLHSPKIFRD